MIRHDALAPEDRWVFAHGFTQTARSWRPFTQVLQAHLPGITTVAIDLPGHGDADAPADGDLWDAARRLVDQGGAATYVGYSMGGRVALHAALADPAAVRALVLIGATAGIDDAAERAERRAADDQLAGRIETIGVDAFVDEWLRNPLFAGLTDETDQRADRRRNRPDGLAASLRATGTGTQDPLWGRLTEVTVPVLVLAGEHDAKFRTLGERMAAILPDATMTVVADAGHSVHLERPEATAEAIAAWRSLRAPAPR